MKRTLELIEERVKTSKRKPADAYKSVFDDLYGILNEAKAFVDSYLAKRKQKGEIKDEKQAIKSIAGNSFSLALTFIFLKNKELGNIREDIFIPSQKSKVPSFNDISVINVGNDMQKPDCDLVIYSLNKDKTLKNCMILSLKTSLREPAGQTYKWKLLMEIASTDNSIRKKYNISYKPKVLPKVCFATVNFYDIINRPQFRGMLKIFDVAFIADHVNSDFLLKMSSLLDYVNNSL
jgi:type II restriction enzyme